MGKYTRLEVTFILLAMVIFFNFWYILIFEYLKKYYGYENT